MIHFPILLKNFKLNKIISHGQRIENENLINIFMKINNLSWKIDIRKHRQRLRNTILKRKLSLHQLNVVRELIFPKQCSHRPFSTWRYCWSPLTSLTFLLLFYWRFNLIINLHCYKGKVGNICHSAVLPLIFFMWLTGALTEHS